MTEKEVNELIAENLKLAAEVDRMRRALLSIYDLSGCIGRGRYSAAFRNAMALARHGLSVPYLKNGYHTTAWEWIRQQGWPGTPEPRVKKHQPAGHENASSTRAA